MQNLCRKSRPISTYFAKILQRCIGTYKNTITKIYCKNSFIMISFNNIKEVDSQNLKDKAEMIPIGPLINKAIQQLQDMAIIPVKFRPSFLSKLIKLLLHPSCTLSSTGSIQGYQHSWPLSTISQLHHMQPLNNAGHSFVSLWPHMN